MPRKKREEPKAAINLSQVDQVAAWILEGNTTPAIIETIKREFPNIDPVELIEAAKTEIAKRAAAPADQVDDWCIAAAKLIHQKQMDLGDYAAALRTLQHIERLTQRLNDERHHPPRATTLLTDPATQKSDTRLIGRAIKNGWNIPPHILNDLPTEIANLSANSRDPRTKLAASKLLIAMHGQNQKSRPQRISHTHTLKPAEPVTPENVDDRRTKLLANLTQQSGNAGGSTPDPDQSSPEGQDARPGKRTRKPRR